MIFLDTNICIHYLNGTAPSVRDHLLNTPPNQIKIPVIVHSELLFGVKKSQRKKENLLSLQRFLEPFEIVNYTSVVSETYAELGLAAESTGKIVGPNHMLIAAIVVANNGTLVTRNRVEFSRFKLLKLLEWWNYRELGPQSLTKILRICFRSRNKDLQSVGWGFYIPVRSLPKHPLPNLPIGYEMRFNHFFVNILLKSTPW